MATHNKDYQSEGSALREEFISAMRNVAASVSVVTTNGPSGKHGATASAFCSLSADPASVLVCLKSDSKIAEMVSTNKSFCVNVLPTEAQMIANRFAGMDDATLKDRFSGISHMENEDRLPVLEGATAFSCLLSQTTSHGSHTVMIGEVQSIQHGTRPPLAYLDGQYQRLVPVHAPDFATCCGNA